jgi:prepilin signal peptidase PulO-like enzyme (type II secretory pathway)
MVLKHKQNFGQFSFLGVIILQNSFFISLLWSIALAFAMPVGTLYFVHLGVGSLAIFASVQDWYSFRLPYIYTVSSIVLAMAGYSIVLGPENTIPGCAAGFAVIKSAQITCRWMHRRECIGSGDALLMCSLGGMVGPLLLLPSCLLSIVSAFIFTKVRRSIAKKIPFGPFLTFGCLMNVLVGGINAN